MVKRFFLPILLILAACLRLGLPVLCDPAPPDRTYISDAAQDGSGQVWATPRNPAGHLYRWQDSKWQDVPLLWAHAYCAVAVAHGPDGRVYCVWQAQFGPGSLLSVHRGRDSRLVARFAGAFDRTTGGGGTLFPPSIFPEAGDGAWIMGQRSTLWHIGLSGHVRSFPIPTAWFYPKRTPQAGNDYYLTTLSAVDSLGRRWFWSDALAGDPDFACLHGALLWDGKVLTSHPAFPGVPDKPFSVIAPQDAGHFWVAVNNTGLYQVDTRTGQGRRVPPPEHGAFLSIEQIFQANGDWYLADWASTPDERSVVLWQQKAAGGRWEKRVPGLDKSTDNSSLQERSWLADPAGLWLGAFGGGAWRLPTRGKAVALDWRRGFPVPFVNRLFRLRDGRLLAAGYDVSTTFPSNLPPMLPSPGFPTRTFQTSPNCGDLSADAHHHLWGLLATDTRLLSEWDGAAWRKHPIPKKVALDALTLFAWDTQERLWLLPYDHTGPAAFFNPKTSAWTAFASCEAAYAAQAGWDGFALHAVNPRQLMPRFGTGGRVCFLSGEYFVHFFDGQRWQKWKIGSIVCQKDESQGGAVSDGPPFFNQAGLLCVNRGKKSFVWTPGGGWNPGAYEAGPDDDSDHLQNNPPTPPPGCPIPHPESIVSDGPAAAWLTSRRQLYRAAFGLVAPQFPPGTAQPFLDGRSVLSVLHDSRDNLFFSTGGEYVVLPAAPDPQTHVAFTPLGTGAARLTFTANPAGHWFVWRLDGGAWSAATRQKNILLDFLPGGPHAAEAIALDARLRFNPVPARTAFTINADPKAQVKALVDTLETGDDNARESAVTHLLRFPALAPPALRAARSGASDAGRWWIDAALQEITAGVSGESPE